MKHRVEYGNFTELMKSSIRQEKTEFDGVMNYELKSIYAPVLDRKYINKFNPKKTCISLCGNEKFELEDENGFIKEIIGSVEKIKYYHLNNHNGQTEHIGEFSLFELLEIPENYRLESYTFGQSDDEYYLILWITPIYFEQRYIKHLYWYEKNHNDEWY